MNFIDSMKKTTSADLKYILHIINYFSQYSMIYLSVTVNVSDIIWALDDVFSQFTQSETFFLDWDQYFKNQIVENYIKT